MGFRLYWRFLSRRIERGKPEFLLSYVNSFSRWQLRVRLGEHPESTVSCREWIEISERTVSRFLARVGRNGDARKRWLTFLRTGATWLCDGLLYGADRNSPTATASFAISHGRRRVLHFNVTEHTTSQWIVQQLREAFPEDDT